MPERAVAQAVAWWRGPGAASECASPTSTESSPMLVLNPFSLRLSLQDTDEFFVSYLLRSYHVLNAQVSGVLGALGTGVAAWPSRETALRVSADASGLTLARGIALVQSEDHGVVVIGTPSDQFFSWASLGVNYGDALANGDALFVYATAIFSANDDTGEGDSRFDNSFDLLVGDEEDHDAAIPLAQISFDSPLVATDQRPFLDWLKLVDEIEQLRADIGYDAAARALGSVHSRLQLLEGGGQSGNPSQNPTVLIAQLSAKVTALETLIVAMQEQLERLGGASDGSADVTARFLNRDIAGLQVMAVHADPQNALRMDAAVFIPGTAGNGEILGADEWGSPIVARDVHIGNTVLDEIRGEQR